MTAPIRDQTAVEVIADDLRAAGTFTLDLEFVSESRYVPELALVQLGWTDPEDRVEDAPETSAAEAALAVNVVAIDPLAVDLASVWALVEDPAMTTVLHAGKQDLELLARRHDLRARNVFDTQIGAAFAGYGEQLGYGRLVSAMLDVDLDKGSQFTNWLRRPLTDRQLRYALDDVRYLTILWPRLRQELADLGRLDWLSDESDRLADAAATPRSPEEAWEKIKGTGRLGPGQRGVLRSLAAWREEIALGENKPPSWIAKDKVMLAMSAAAPKDSDALSKIPGVGPGTLRAHTDDILRAIALGREQPMPLTSERPAELTPRGGALAQVVLGLARATSLDLGVAPSLLATRDDVERLVAWALAEPRGTEPNIQPLRGWRRHAFGAPALRFLTGEARLTATTDREGGLLLET